MCSNPLMLLLIQSQMYKITFLCNLLLIFLSSLICFLLTVIHSQPHWLLALPNHNYNNKSSLTLLAQGLSFISSLLLIVAFLGHSVKGSTSHLFPELPFLLYYLIFLSTYHFLIYNLPKLLCSLYVSFFLPEECKLHGGRINFILLSNSVAKKCLSYSWCSINTHQIKRWEEEMQSEGYYP